MLLSIPTWIIHLLTVSEWLAALLLIHRYGVRIARPGLRLFAVAMLPHLVGGLLVLAFHASGDRLGGLLATARLFTFLGSLSLLAATLWLLLRARSAAVWVVAGLLAAGVVWGASQLLGKADTAALLPGASLAYLAFLVLLVVLQRREPVLFSPVTVAGFWLLLLFVAGTIAATVFATGQLGLASLSHADLLHGGSELLLTASNLLIAWGVYRRLKALEPANGYSPGAREAGC
ncbi:MAG: DUF2499 domain-containing protein [Gammaproteobacteria bacterium]|jgi:hypothetical protein|nr:DUF2499 domain-containing protein [Gammaproteobacteria bacterium]